MEVNNRMIVIPTVNMQVYSKLNTKSRPGTNVQKKIQKIHPNARGFLPDGRSGGRNENRGGN